MLLKSLVDLLQSINDVFLIDLDGSEPQNTSQNGPEMDQKWIKNGSTNHYDVCMLSEPANHRFPVLKFDDFWTVSWNESNTFL